MEKKLIVKAAAIGVSTAAAFIISSLLFIVFFAPHLSNIGFEEYIFALVLIALLPSSVYAYKNAGSRKFLHAVVVYFLALFLLLIFILFISLLLYLALLIICSVGDCRIFPFL